MDAPEVAEVTDDAAGNPGAADLQRRGRGQRSEQMTGRHRPQHQSI